MLKLVTIQPVQAQDGAYGSGEALYFNGEHDRFALGNVTSTDNYYSRRTYEMWFKPDEVSAESGLQILFKAGAEANGFTFFLHDETLYGGAWDEDGQVWLDIPVDGEEVSGSWHHFAMVFDGPEGELRGYFDGEVSKQEIQDWAGLPRVSSHEGFDAIANVSDDGLLPRFGPAEVTDEEETNPGFAGEVDQFRLWDRAIATQEIWELSRKKLEDPEVEAENNDLRIALRFDGTEQDLSGNMPGIENSEDLGFLSGRNAVSLVVDYEDVLRKKNEQLLGANREIRFEAAMVNEDSENGFYEFPDGFMNVYDKSGISFSRWPGGTASNTVNWKHTIGPVEERISGKRDMIPYYGLDEWAQSDEEINANGLICFSWGYNTPEDAAHLVEYLNAEVGANPTGGTDWAQLRADNGHPEPYDIKHIELGNELAGNWANSWMNYDINNNNQWAAGNKGAQRYIQGGSQEYRSQPAVKYYTRDELDKRDGEIIKSGNFEGDLYGMSTRSVAGEKFYVHFPPIDFNEDFAVYVGDEQWTRVEDFSDSGSDDKHYTVEPEIGKITFGDGSNGALPQEGEEVVVDYTSGPHAGFGEYYQAVKDVDSDVQVLNTYAHSFNSEVNDDVFVEMEENPTPYDGFSLHWYYELGSSPTNYEGENSTLEMLARLTQLEGYVNSVHENIQEHPNSALDGDDEPSVYITEFDMGNMVIADGGTPAVTTIQGAISYGALFSELMNESYGEKIETTMHHFLVRASREYNRTRMIVPTKWQLQGNTYAYHLFSQLDENILASEISNQIKDAYDPLNGRVDYFDRIFATAARPANAEGKISLILVNTSMKRVEVDITLENYQVDGSLDGQVKKVVPNYKLANWLHERNGRDQSAIQIMEERFKGIDSEEFTFTMDPGSLNLLILE